MVPSTVTNARDRCASGSLLKAGKQPLLGDWFDKVLVEWIKIKRLVLRVPVSKASLSNHT